MGDLATRRALVLTYHAVGEGPPPLVVTAELFRRHLDVLERIRARTLTVSELAIRMRERDLPDRSVAITFDDGEAGAVRFAMPLLLERGMTATVFCVAGHLGGASDWSTYPERAPRFQLASAAELAELARAGIEIGCHGYTHEPLAAVSRETAHREVIESQSTLTEAVDARVRTFAWPYGARPNAVAAQLIAENYTAACSATIGRIDTRSRVMALPRVDAHYLRSPALLQRVAAGGWDIYLGLRALGAHARRAARPDYVSVENGEG